MKRLLKNKYVVLFGTIIILSIVYFGVNKAIKKYNFEDNEELLVEENSDESKLDEDKADVEKDGVEEYSVEETNLETEEILDENNVDGSNNQDDDNEVEKDTLNKIYVYITGEVKNPGVLTLNDGSRIVDAINVAGGTTGRANISKINLVYVLEDGMKINIPNDNDLKNNPDFEYITMSSGNGINDGEYGTNHDDSKEREEKDFDKRNNIEIVNINTATQTELETLPGIGPSTALKIINYRKENGKFSSIEEIKNVSGVGDSKFDELKKYIKV